MKKSPLDFCSISDRSVSSGGTLLPWVSITALASLGAVKPTLGSKVPPLETLLPDMEKKSSGFFISDDGKRQCYMYRPRRMWKKWRFLFVASRHEKENLKAMEKKWKERLYANKDELVLEYKLIFSAKIQIGVVHLDVYFIFFIFCYLQVYTFLNQYQIGWVHFRKKK